MITLRADFYAHCAQYEQLREALASHQVYIGTMTKDELRRAIEVPAQNNDWKFEPELVNTLPGCRPSGNTVCHFALWPASAALYAAARAFATNQTELLYLPFEKSLQMFASGEIEWAGCIGCPGRGVPDCG